MPLVAVAVSRLGVATLGLAVFSAAAFGWSVHDGRDRTVARAVAAHGGPARADGVRVHLQEQHTRGSNGLEVDAVTAVVPGRGRVQLFGPSNTAIHPPGTLQPGWRSPTRETGYDAEPLPVRVLDRDGSITVMAQPDVDRLTRSRDPEIGLGLGVGAIALAGIIAAMGIAGDRRRSRRRAAGG